ncbi:steroidogenic acute regulatory protein, mitochondrial [Pangasianodon hypophthalmus]|uniref:steroidogenic acute regulatory protein, mitochondrial n=1 Tax=Pangasianodon hypophthalmus TaxID=310915 RepID=UPI002307B6A7|nr:steroidogenic acute regulatory protein, mitochondrial [Pangasianodon hypophthalmus]
MLSAVAKLCCGISYQHLRSVTGLQRTAMAALGQEIAHMQKTGRVSVGSRSWDVAWSWRNISEETERTDGRRDGVEDTDLSYQQQGQEALQRALDITRNVDGWRTEITEDSGDVIYSKVVQGNRKVFRLEAELDASPDELYEVLFVKVEEMNEWNPSIAHIKVLKHIGKETMVTHEVSAGKAGNLIGQRDFLSVRHSLKTKRCIYLGGAATHLEAFPPQPGFIRAEDGPTCIIIQPSPGCAGKSKFTWLLNMDVKGWLPKSLVNQALPQAQLDFTRHLRRRLEMSRK